MIGKFICLLLALAAVQAYQAPLHPPVEPFDMIHDLLERLKDLMDEAKKMVAKLESIISNNQQLIDQVNVDIEAIISVAEGIVSSTGECGQAAVPDIDKAKNDTQAGVKQCVSRATDEGNAILKEVEPMLKEAETIVNEIEAGIDECNAKDNPLICLGGLTFAEEYKVEDNVQKMVPLISEIVRLEIDLEKCVVGAKDTLVTEIQAILSDIVNCGKGGLM